MNRKNRIVTDRETDTTIESLVTGTVIPAEEFFGGGGIDKLRVDRLEHDNSFHQVSPAELKLVKAVVEYPMRRSSEYAKLAKISSNTMKKIRPELVNKGFIRENKLESMNRGRAAILLEPLEPALQLISNYQNWSICEVIPYTTSWVPRSRKSRTGTLSSSPANIAKMPMV